MNTCTVASNAAAPNDTIQTYLTEAIEAISAKQFALASERLEACLKMDDRLSHLYVTCSKMASKALPCPDMLVKMPCAFSIEVDPVWLQTYLHVFDLFGFVRFFQGDYSGAERCCRSALLLKADHAYAWKGLGLSLARQGKVQEGSLCIEKAIALLPEWYDPYWDLAVIQYERGDVASAKMQLLKTIERFPERQAELQSFLERLIAVDTA